MDRKFAAALGVRTVSTNSECVVTRLADRLSTGMARAGLCLAAPGKPSREAGLALPGRLPGGVWPGHPPGRLPGLAGERSREGFPEGGPGHNFARKSRRVIPRGVQRGPGGYPGRGGGG